MTPFRFEPGKSFLHRLNPALKFFCLILLSSGLMVAPAPLAAALAAFCLACVLLMRIPALELFRKGRFLAWMAAFVFVLKCVGSSSFPFVLTEELIPAALYVADLCLLFLLTELFFRSTKVGDLGAALSRSIRSLTRREDIDPGLYIALAVNFIPRVFSVYRECADAAIARGFGKRRYRYRSIIALIIAYMRISIKKALWTADALEARCYRPDRSVDAPGISKADLAACGLCVGYFAASLFI